MAIFDHDVPSGETPSEGDVCMFSGTVRKMSSDHSTWVLSDRVTHGEFTLTPENRHHGVTPDNGGGDDDGGLEVTLDMPDVTSQSHWQDLTFSWEPVTGAVNYELKLNNVSKGSTTDTTATFLNLPPMFYQFQVRARGTGNNVSDWGGAGVLAQVEPEFQEPLVTSLSPTKPGNDGALVGRWAMPVNFIITGQHLLGVTGVNLTNDDNEIFEIELQDIADDEIQGIIPIRDDVTINSVEGDQAPYPYFTLSLREQNGGVLSPAFVIYELMPLNITDRTDLDQARRNFSTDMFFEGENLANVKEIYIGPDSTTDVDANSYKVDSPSITDVRIDYTIPQESELLTPTNAPATTGHAGTVIFKMVDGSYQSSGFTYAWNKLD